MEWVRGDEIGYGSFSTVNLAITKNPSAQFPQIMAVKSACISQTGMLLREKSILDELKDCPHVVKCFGSDYTIEKGEKTFNIFLEYASGGTLAYKIKKKHNHRLHEHETRRYTKNILEGVKYIHEKDYVHSDLKLENILLFPSSKDYNHDELKIADFGLATKTIERALIRKEIHGTPLYISPEAVVKGEVGTAGDIWAVGCMVAEMVTGAPAWWWPDMVAGAPGKWPEMGVFQLLMRIGVGDELPEIPKGLSDEGKDFLSKIFVKDPEKRWTAQMLLDHPFITNERFCKEDCCMNSPRGPLDCVDEYESKLFSLDSDLNNMHSSDLEKWCSRQVDLRKASCKVTKLPLSDFDIWTSSDVCFESNADRLRNLVNCQGPDWSETDGWINVR